MRWLVKNSLDNWNTNHTTLTRVAVELLADADPRADKAKILTVYDGLHVGYQMDDSDAASARPLCRTWLERRQMEVVAERAIRKAKAGDVVGAQDLLSQSKLKDLDDVRVVSLNATSVDFMQTLVIPSKGFIPTGWAEIDELWEGGVRAGELGMVLAPTGIGKSMALSFFAATAFWHGGKLCGKCGKERGGRHDKEYQDTKGVTRKGHGFVETRMDILYYTFELTEEQIRDRIALAILQKGKLDIKGTWADEVAAKCKRDGVPLPNVNLEVRNKTMNWADLTADLEDYKRLNGKYPDLLLLDSADDIAPIRGRDARHSELLEAFVYLRAMANRMRMRVWTTGQLNRDSVEKARVNLKMIGDAFAKAQKSHYVMGFAQTQQDREHAYGPNVQLYVLKDSTHGTVGGHLEMHVDFGVGFNGYAGFEVTHTHGLPIVGGGMSTSSPEEET